MRIEFIFVVSWVGIGFTFKAGLVYHRIYFCSQAGRRRTYFYSQGGWELDGLEMFNFLVRRNIGYISIVFWEFEQILTTDNIYPQDHFTIHRPDNYCHPFIVKRDPAVGR